MDQVDVCAFDVAIQLSPFEEVTWHRRWDVQQTCENGLEDTKLAIKGPKAMGGLEGDNPT